MNLRQHAQLDAAKLLSERIFNATVDSTSGGLIKIKRIGQTVADDQFYPAADGLAAAVSGDDIVMCAVVGGHVQVLAKIVTS